MLCSPYTGYIIIITPPLSALPFSLTPSSHGELNCMSGFFLVIGWKKESRTRKGRRRRRGEGVLLLLARLFCLICHNHHPHRQQKTALPSSYSIIQHHIWQSLEILIIGLTMKSVTRKLSLFFPAFLPRTTLDRHKDEKSQVQNLDLIAAQMSQQPRFSSCSFSLKSEEWRCFERRFWQKKPIEQQQWHLQVSWKPFMKDQEVPFNYI